MSTLATNRIQMINDEVRSLAFSHFEHADALSLGKVLLHLAEQRALRVAVGVNLGEHIIFRGSLPGTNADYQYWIERKFNAVRRFAKSTLELELLATENPQFASERALEPAQYALCGGAVPILVGGTVAGYVGCAGLASQDDHALVVEALKIHLKNVDWV